MEENKRLKRDNQKLQDSLNELQKYKDSYKELIDSLTNVKETYLNKIKDFDALEKQYRKELDKVIKNTKTQHKDR